MDSSVSSSDKKQYDVFLSFRGKDTRRGIVSHLYNALVGRTDDIFKDDETLEIGDSISKEIKEAIRNSKFAIVVLSANYVSSTWCLNELQMIMELHKEHQLVVVPIFYEVDPSDVKHQKGAFSLKRYKCSTIMRFLSSKKRKRAARVRKWGEALTKVGETSGKDSRACEDEATLVEDVVKYIARESKPPMQMGDIVGMDAHMAQIDPLLDMDSTTDEVRMIGIWGMGGIGKTTIATYICNKYSPRFARRFCLIRNIRDSANDLPGLQTELLSTILGKKQTTIKNEDQGCTVIKSKLKKLKILLVLDDVDNIHQLRALAKEISWFGPGSRIIITTRDLGLLYSFGMRFVHHVAFLGIDDSIQLFKNVAFDGGRAPSDNFPIYEQLLIRASKLAQGLPSAIDAFGTYLHQMKSAEEWEEALDFLEKFPHQSIMDILKISYEGLDERDQAVFLQLACLFNGEAVHRVTALIDDGDIRIKGLEKKSLIDISPDGCITMHVLVEQAARDIVRRESKSKLWRQRVLWEPEQIVSVLQNTTNTATTEGVSLHMCEMPCTESIQGETLKAISNLKFFKAFTHLNNLESKLQFLPGTDKLPKFLRLLHWDFYPMTTLPSEYYSNFLVELNLRYSNLVRLCDGTLDFNKLRKLDVTGSENLTEIPDLSKATLLEELIMKGCRRLEQTPESIGRLSFLQKLDLSECDRLMNLQTDISEKPVLECEVRRRQQIMLKLPRAVKKLSSLANLSIEGKIHIDLFHLNGYSEHLSFISDQQIRELKTVPKESPVFSSFYDFKSLSIKRFSYIEDGGRFCCISFSRFPCLAELNLINLNIKKIPDDIDQLQSLEKLDLSGNDFRNLPTSMKILSNLKHFRLSNCRKLVALPKMTELQTLQLSGCYNLRSLVEPSHAVEDIGIYSLLELHLDHCKNIQSLSNQLSHFTNLMYLDLSSHDFELIPESITELVCLGTLCINNCNKLKTVEELPQSLNHLYAHGCYSLENVSLSQNHSIQHLDLSHCFYLQQNEQLITQFLNNQEVSQRFLCLPGARVPEYFDNQSTGASTEIRRLPITFTTTLLSFAACIMISCERSFHLQFPAFSYDWNCEDDEIIRINLKPRLYRSSEIEEEERIPSRHLVIIHVPSSINTEKFQELRFESNLQFPQEFQFSPGEINSCGIRIIAEDCTN